MSGASRWLPVAQGIKNTASLQRCANRTLQLVKAADVDSRQRVEMCIRVLLEGQANANIGKLSRLLSGETRVVFELLLKEQHALYEQNKREMEAKVCIAAASLSVKRLTAPSCRLKPSRLRSFRSVSSGAFLCRENGM